MSELGLIENYYAEQNSIIELLYLHGEVSLAQTAQNLFAKSLLLIAASHFEDQLKHVVTSGVAARSGNDPYINTFFKMRGISYQDHAWFDWDKGNANRFYSFFGKKFAEAMKSAIEADGNLSECVTSLVKIGDLRNQIVHNNILVFKLDDKPDERKYRRTSPLLHSRKGAISITRPSVCSAISCAIEEKNDGEQS